jgi:molecular chaperone GrpE (heat shock protein)
MHAVDVEETDQQAEGTVLEVYRAGYEWKGEVHRPARVKVARRRTAILAGGNENDE